MVVGLPRVLPITMFNERSCFFSYCYFLSYSWHYCLILVALDIGNFHDVSIRIWDIRLIRRRQQQYLDIDLIMRADNLNPSSQRA